MTTIRRPGAASATTLLVLTAGLVLAHAIAPDWSRRVGLDVWNWAEVAQAHRRAEDGRAAMTENIERCARRREVANQLAAQLAAGDTTLAAVTDQIREMFADDPGMLSGA